MSKQKDTVTTKDINKAAFRYMFMACNTFNYETQQGPAVVFGLNKLLRKIYPNDNEYLASLNNHFKYFNTTTWMANVLLGASVAMEEKDGAAAHDAVKSFKTGMMGPLAGIGDTLCLGSLSNHHWFYICLYGTRGKSDRSNCLAFTQSAFLVIPF